MCAVGVQRLHDDARRPEDGWLAAIVEDRGHPIRSSGDRRHEDRLVCYTLHLNTLASVRISRGHRYLDLIAGDRELRVVWLASDIDAAEVDGHGLAVEGSCCDRPGIAAGLTTSRSRQPGEDGEKTQDNEGSVHCVRPFELTDLDLDGSASARVRIRGTRKRTNPGRAGTGSPGHWSTPASSRFAYR